MEAYDQIDIGNLLMAADRHCEATGKSRSTIANQIVKDARFFDRIESGGGCTIDTYNRIMAWFRENTPTETPAPEPSHA